jgi:GNAT superfamily N-acetyltransferase
VSPAGAVGFHVQRGGELVMAEDHGVAADGQGEVEAPALIFAGTDIKVADEEMAPICLQWDAFRGTYPFQEAWPYVWRWEAWFGVQVVSLITYVRQTGWLARRLIQRSSWGRVRVNDNVATTRQFLEQRIHAYNVATTGITDGQVLTIVSRDEQGAIMAGLVGWTWGGCVEIEYLWVHEHRRGQGYGTRLLAAAEDEARKRGCQQALLITYSFQAPEFYTKVGYTVYAELNDCPNGHKRHYLKKHLCTP